MTRFLTGNMAAAADERSPADFHATPRPALDVLLVAEDERLPEHIWEPACGDGAIVIPLRNFGYTVLATDLHDWGCPASQTGFDFLGTLQGVPMMPVSIGIVTNPPFNIAEQFVERACSLSTYVAMLLRLAFLESDGRHGWLNRMGLRRVHVISDRLPMMHRFGHKGPKLDKSAMAFAWFIFEPSARIERYAKLYWWRWHDCQKIVRWRKVTVS